MSELLPCPFCGNDEIVRDHPFGSPLRLRCDACHASIPWISGEEELIAAWNRRAFPTAQDARTVSAEGQVTTDQIKSRMCQFDHECTWPECNCPRRAVAGAAARPDAADNTHKLYEELIYAVGNKYPGESRHETALRYIRQAEAPKNDQTAKSDAAIDAAGAKT